MISLDTHVLYCFFYFLYPRKWICYYTSIVMNFNLHRCAIVFPGLAGSFYLVFKYELHG